MTRLRSPGGFSHENGERKPSNRARPSSWPARDSGRGLGMSYGKLGQALALAPAVRTYCVMASRVECGSNPPGAQATTGSPRAVTLRTSDDKFKRYVQSSDHGSKRRRKSERSRDREWSNVSIGAFDEGAHLTSEGPDGKTTLGKPAGTCAWGSRSLRGSDPCRARGGAARIGPPDSRSPGLAVTHSDVADRPRPRH